MCSQFESSGDSVLVTVLVPGSLGPPDSGLRGTHPGLEPRLPQPEKEFRVFRRTKKINFFSVERNTARCLSVNVLMKADLV